MGQNNYTDELYHYGRKGMRWGQHIFGKEPTGSAGSRKKSSNSVAKSIKKVMENQKKKREEAAKAKRTKKSIEGNSKSIKDMSNDELSTVIKRLEMEQRYQTLVNDPRKVSKGKRFAENFFEKAVLPGVANAGSKLIETQLTKLGKKYLGLEEEQTKSVRDKAADAKAEWEIKFYKDKMKSMS